MFRFPFIVPPLLSPAGWELIKGVGLLFLYPGLIFINNGFSELFSESKLGVVEEEEDFWLGPSIRHVQMNNGERKWEYSIRGKSIFSILQLINLIIWSHWSNEIKCSEGLYFYFLMLSFSSSFISWIIESSGPILSFCMKEQAQFWADSQFSKRQKWE